MFDNGEKEKCTHNDKYKNTNIFHVKYLIKKEQTYFKRIYCKMLILY